MNTTLARLSLLAVWMFLTAGYFVGCGDAKSSGAIHPSQTSASMLVQYAESVKNSAPMEKKAEAELKFVLTYDIYIKARSYAILNKIFFWFSVLFALGVLIWPTLGIVFKDRLDKVEWVKSAIVQTTVTGLAALMFAFYSQYKDKQTYAETLMRSVVFSRQDAYSLAIKVSEELGRIDRGFSFNSIVGEDPKGGPKADSGTNVKEE